MSAARKMRWTSLFIAMLFLAGPAAGRDEETASEAAPAPKGVRVAPFKAKGQAEAELAESVTALVSQAVAEAPCARLVSEDMLAEQARKQMMGESCQGASCEEKAQEGAHADLLVRGDLLKIGQTYIATAMVVDIASRKTLFSGKATSQGQETLAEEAAKLAARTADSLACPAP